MWTLLVGLALSGAPADVDLDDLDRWEGGAERVLDGPAGCWEIVGHASWDWDAGRWGASRGDTIFVSRMVDGVWGPFHLEPLGEVVRERKSDTESRIYGYEPRWAPLIGKLDGEVSVSNAETDVVLAEDTEPSRADKRRERRRARSDEEPRDDGPSNVVREALDELAGEAATTSWTQWDGATEAVLLHRQVPVSDAGKSAEQTFSFPGGGLPVSMDVVFPQTFYRGTLPRVRVSDAVVKVRVRPSGGELFPTMEAFKVEFGVFGFTVHGAQTIKYKSIRGCTTAPPAPEVVQEHRMKDGK